jgi:hypothetical protein
LTIGAISISNSDYTVTLAPATSLPAISGSTLFFVKYSPTSLGTADAIVSIVTNDLDENPYTFAITGAGITPEVLITGRGNEIVSGDTSASTVTGTMYGNVSVGGTYARSYTITNTGVQALTIGAISFSNTDYTVSQLPASTIAAGGSTSFIIAFSPSTVGVVDATVSIVTNDLDENPYTFAITGTGTPATPVRVGATDEVEAILETATTEAVSMYPNPTKGAFTLSVAEAGTAFIYDALGKEIQSVSVVAGMNSLDIESQLPGVYFVKVSISNKVMKLVKE